MNKTEAAALRPGTVIELADTDDAVGRYGSTAGHHVRLHRVEYCDGETTLIARPAGDPPGRHELIIEPEDIARVVNVPAPMTPGKGAGRLSCLIVNPRNREASAARRALLLSAFDELDDGTRADFLEAVESLVFQAHMSVSSERDDARDIIKQVYAIAGWEQS